MNEDIKLIKEINMCRLAITLGDVAINCHVQNTKLTVFKVRKCVNPNDLIGITDKDIESLISDPDVYDEYIEICDRVLNKRPNTPYYRGAKWTR